MKRTAPAIAARSGRNDVEARWMVGANRRNSRRRHCPGAVPGTALGRSVISETRASAPPRIPSRWTCPNDSVSCTAKANNASQPPKRLLFRIRCIRRNFVPRYLPARIAYSRSGLAQCDQCGGLRAKLNWRQLWPECNIGVVPRSAVPATDASKLLIALRFYPLDIGTLHAKRFPPTATAVVEAVIDHPRSPPRQSQLLRNAGIKAATCAILWSKYADAAAVAQLVKVVEQIDDVETERHRLKLRRPLDVARDAEIDHGIGRVAVRIGATPSDRSPARRPLP